MLLVFRCCRPPRRLVMPSVAQPQHTPGYSANRTDTNYPRQTQNTCSKYKIPTSNTKYLQQTQNTCSKHKIPAANTKYLQQTQNTCSKHKIPAANTKYLRQTQNTCSKHKIPAANTKTVHNQYISFLARFTKREFPLSIATDSTMTDFRPMQVLLEIESRTFLRLFLIE